MLTTLTLAVAIVSGAATPVPQEHREEFYPSDAQVIRYLEGKRIKGPAAKAERELTIPKGGIVAIEVGRSASGSESGVGGAPKTPWETSVLFIVQKGNKRYAIEGCVKHLRVGSDRAFYGFTARSIVEQ